MGAELTAYRVVQESLTNAVKYASGQPTLARPAHTPDRTDVQVTTTGTADGASASPPSTMAARTFRALVLAYRAGLVGGGD
jgi:hypothetical protein